MANPSQADTDVDGIGDACDDTDDNGLVWVSGDATEERLPAGSSGICPSGSSGKKFTVTLKGYDLTGLRHLTSYEFSGKFCYGKVQGKKQLTAWKDLFATSRKASWPWEWRGNVFEPRGFGVGSYSGRAEAQGKYESCLFRWGCVRTMTEWITVYANADGNWSFNWGS